MQDEENNTDDELHKIGPYLLRKVKPGLTTAGIEPTYALCSPDRWGMRYSDLDPERRAHLMYPIARDYAKAMQKVMLEQIQWGDTYFGPAGSTPALKLQWPFDDSQVRQFFALVQPAMVAAMTGLAGGFGIPADAVPPILSYTPQLDGEKGAFNITSWTMQINMASLKAMSPTGESARIFRGKSRSAQVLPLQEMADTLYHESRHCQQFFWMYALVHQYPDNFEAMPNISKWPEASSNLQRFAHLARVLSLTTSQALPDDTATLISLKRMAVGAYFWDLHEWRSGTYRPIYLAEPGEFEAEYQRARSVAIDLLQHVGLGGTPIDVDEMVQDAGKCYWGYTSRPWENDAFCCGEMAAAYWWAGMDPHNALNTYPADQCSNAYELADRMRKYASAAKQSSGSSRGGQ
ncbi:hypothetical protein [Paraburkholderia sp. J67]|uniref:hypothetical protein n=1 Tax=Paraburkholderia sp. J67 TaxID=2805435 RepID=UPI002ABD7BFC|nr:hypothetical protein [Paraburkholderia sp. J67]